MPAPLVQPPAPALPTIVWPSLPMSPLVRMRDDVVSVVQPANQQAAATLAVLAWTWAQERAQLHAHFTKRTPVNPPVMFSMLRSAGITCLHDLALGTWNLASSNVVLHEALHHVALPTEFQQLTLFARPGTDPDAGSPVALPRHLLERILDCANSRVLSWAEPDGHRHDARFNPPRVGSSVLLCPRFEVEPGPSGVTLHWIMPIVRHHLELVEQPPRTVNLGVAPPSVLAQVPATEWTNTAQRQVTFPTQSASMLVTYELVLLRQYLDPTAPGARHELGMHERQGLAAVCVFNIFLLGELEREALRAEAAQGSQVPPAVTSARASCRLDDFRDVARSYIGASPEHGPVDAFFEWLRRLGSTEWRRTLVNRSLTFLSGYWPSIEAVTWPETGPGQVAAAQPDAHRRAGHLFMRFNQILAHLHNLAHPIDGPVAAGPSVYEPQSRQHGNA